MNTRTYLLLLASVCCAGPRPLSPLPLVAGELSMMGCYDLVAGPWPTLHDSSSTFEVQLDSAGSVTARRLIVFSSPMPWQRAAYWTLTAPNAFTAHLVWGVEGQGFEFQLRLTGDSVTGAAAEHLRPGDARIAPARGVRRPCR